MGVGGSVDCIFSCFGVRFVVFVVCACLACPLVFGSFASCLCLRLRFACWLRLRLLLRLGLASRPVFGACGCFVLSVFPVAAAMSL